MIFEYWKSTLPAKKRVLYEEMLSKFTAGEYEVESRLSPQETVDLYCMVKQDHPELFNLTNSPKVGSKGFGVVFVGDTIYSAREISFRRAAMKNAAMSLLAKTSGMSDFEKECEILEYLIPNVKYAINDRTNQDASSALFSRKAQCSGIAAAFKYLADSINLKSITVTGTFSARGATISHSWNVVSVNGKYYHLDATNIIGANDSGKPPFRFSYFNLSDKQVSSNYKWQKGIPVCGEEYKNPSRRGVDFTPYPEGFVNSSESIKISSVEEFKRLFTSALDNQNSFAFYSQIKCANDDELMNIISDACRQCISQKKKSYKLKLGVSASVVTLEW